jgi:hypothetical protein
MGRPRKPMDDLERNGSFDKHPDRRQQRVEELLAEIARAKAAGPIGDPPACFDAESYTGSKMIALWQEIITEAPPGALLFYDRKHVEGLVRLLYKIRCSPTSAKTADYNAYFAALGKIKMNPESRGRGDIVPLATNPNHHTGSNDERSSGTTTNVFAELAEEERTDTIQ